MYIKELTNDEFKKFCNHFNNKSIYQTVEYGLVMNNQKFDTIFLGLINDQNQIVAASLILIEHLNKFKYAYAPKGFLIDYNNFNLLNTFTREIKKYLGHKNIIAIKICPMVIKSIYDKKNKVLSKNNYYDNIFNNLTNLGYHHLGYNHFFEALKPRYEAIIDLNIPYYMLFNNIRKEFRTKIRSAEDKGIKVYKGTKKELEYLYHQTKTKYPRDLKYFDDCYDYFDKNKQIDFYYSKLDTAKYLKISQKKYHEEEVNCNKITSLIKENGATSKLINEKMEQDKKFNKSKKELIRATELLRNNPDGIVTASILIVKNNDEVFMIMDGYDPKYKSFNSKHLLIWKLIERYSKQGFKKFNLNGITNVDIEKNKYTGLNNFKLGFNALCYEYIGDLELVTNNTLYLIYRNTSPIRSILKK